jgi:hypothetical protein
MFDWLDVDKGGANKFEDFVHGLDWLNEAVTGKSLVKLESAFRRRCCDLLRSMNMVRKQRKIVNDEDISGAISSTCSSQATLRRGSSAHHLDFGNVASGECARACGCVFLAR